MVGYPVAYPPRLRVPPSRLTTLPLKIAILGAGVSGLALARRLIEAGFPQADIHLFEAAGEIGGLCRSKTVDGFTYDTSGGHVLFSKDKETMDWMKKEAGGAEAFVKRNRTTRIQLCRPRKLL